MSRSNEDHGRVERLQRVILSLGSTCLALVIVIVCLIRPHLSSQLDPTSLLSDPNAKESVIARLANEHGELYDSHSDADVGRVLLPNLKDRSVRGSSVTTNRYGIRERNYVLPKPNGMIRIVLLGDSFVYGRGVAASERMGVHLERWLRENCPDAVPIEVLHIGVSSWNYQAQTAYLRRQLHDLRPDLVIQIALPNDIEPSAGIRGFGKMARHSPQFPLFADSVLNAAFPRQMLLQAATNYLRFGIDFESRSRYQAARDDIQKLLLALDNYGCRYRLLFHYHRQLSVAWKHIGRHFDPSKMVYLSKDFASESRYWISESDYHWNTDGHLIVAKLIYGMIARERLLPGVEAPIWDEAAIIFDRITGPGRIDAERDLTDDAVLRTGSDRQIASHIDFEALTESTAAQIHGGVDSSHRASPYASFVLKNNNRSHVRIQGTALPDNVLNNTHVQVYIGPDCVGSIELVADARFDKTFILPAANRDTPFINLRLISPDYVYRGNDLQHCVAYQLRRVSIEMP